jgi:putative membrane protein
MSELNDPRVLFAAERTLLAWTRTTSGLLGLGFIIDRAALMVDARGGERGLALAVGVAFVLLGVVLNALSVVQYRRSIAGLRPVEIPPHYWVNLTVLASVAVSVLGLTLAFYLFWGY